MDQGMRELVDLEWKMEGFVDRGMHILKFNHSNSICKSRFRSQRVTASGLILRDYSTPYSRPIRNREAAPGRTGGNFKGLSPTKCPS